MDENQRERQALHAELTGSGDAREDDPVVARDVDRLVPDRLDRDQRDVRDDMAGAPKALDELPFTADGASDDDSRHVLLCRPVPSPRPPTGSPRVAAEV